MSLDAEVTRLHAAPEDDSETVSGSAEFGRRLRFLVCGSVDDGKSTLIGRLLWDTKSVSDDHREALVAKGSRQNDLQLPDFGLLLDGLKAEQEQGITIDVAYRYFHTPKRAFIVADTPGHAQYTRNMATGASTADLAVLLVDARAGLLATPPSSASWASVR
jgi:sulfate adenylyltransferase subunit 1